MPTKKQKLAKENNALWQEVCLGLWGDKCLVCGESPIIFHHFIIKSRNGLMAYDEQNGIPLCQRHHYIIHFSSSPSEIHRVVQTIREAKEDDWCKYIDKHERIHRASFKTLKWLKDENRRLQNILLS